MPRNLTAKNQEDADKQYLQLVLAKIEVCKAYTPKFGQGNSVSLEQFAALYGNDAFYGWFGMDNPLLYAAHKAAGGITSLYRQIGLGCEILFRQIICDKLQLNPLQVAWSYTKRNPGRKRNTKLTLDARISTDEVQNAPARKRVQKWLDAAARETGVAPAIADNLSGAVFEVRQGYKSADSKRSNADIAHAGTAYSKGYLPVAAILSNQINEDVADAYKRAGWLVLRGVNHDSSVVSTYAFTKQVLGYDLAAFFERNSPKLKATVKEVLKALLAPETPRDVPPPEITQGDELIAPQELMDEL